MSVKRQLSIPACVCPLIDNCGFVTIDIKPTPQTPNPAPSLRLRLHVCMCFPAGWEFRLSFTFYPVAPKKLATDNRIKQLNRHFLFHFIVFFFFFIFNPTNFYYFLLFPQTRRRERKKKKNTPLSSASS